MLGVLASVLAGCKMNNIHPALNISCSIRSGLLSEARLDDFPCTNTGPGCRVSLEGFLEPPPGTTFTSCEADWLDSPGRGFLQGCIKFPTTLYYFSSPLFKCFPKVSVPFPYSPLDIVHNSLNFIEQMKLLPLSLFSTLESPQWS